MFSWHGFRRYILAYPGRCMKVEAFLYRLTRRRDGPWTPIYFVRSFVPLTTSGLVLSKLDSPGGDVAGHSSDAQMIQMRLCWGGASRAEEAGGTGSIRLCWDLSQSGTKPAVSCSTDILWTQIHVLDIALFNCSATALQHGCRHAPTTITISLGYLSAC